MQHSYAPPPGISQSGADARYVNVPGDTMTGALFIDGSADVTQLLVQAAAGQTLGPIIYENSGGTDLFQMTAGAAFQFAAGTAVAPVLRFIADPDTGIFNAGPNVLGFTAGAVQTAILDATGLTLAGGLSLPTGGGGDFRIARFGPFAIAALSTEQEVCDFAPDFADANYTVAAVLHSASGEADCTIRTIVNKQPGSFDIWIRNDSAAGRNVNVEAILIHD